MGLGKEKRSHWRETMGSLPHGPLVTERVRVKPSTPETVSWSLSAQSHANRYPGRGWKSSAPLTLAHTPNRRNQAFHLRRKAQTNEPAFLQPSTAKMKLRVELLNMVQIIKNKLDPQPTAAKQKEAACPRWCDGTKHSGEIRNKFTWILY